MQTRREAGARVSVVVLTFNRRFEVARCIAHLLALPERPRVIVVDNHSTDGTAEYLAHLYPAVTLIGADTNLGAAGRNLGVDCVDTPYVAFCDDDTWWRPGALRQATALLDRHPRIGVISACVLVGNEQRVDPACVAMAASPLNEPGMPGPLLIGFMAGAAVMRTQAFRDAGGYEPRLFIGCEESLLALELATRGWRIVYSDAVTSHHHPSAARDGTSRAMLLQRNLFGIAWLRLPLHLALGHTREIWRSAAAQGQLLPLVQAAIPLLPWLIRKRRVVPADVQVQWERVHSIPTRLSRSAAHPAPQAQPFGQRASTK
jgi:GT2 family glycosyltransferase